MLATQGIISNADRMAIEQGLNQILEEIRNHQFVWQQALEDVHLNIEKRLTALVGDAGKRLHTPAHVMIRLLPIFVYFCVLPSMKSSV